ncbi:MAG: hypothetical protein LBG29_04345 [Synergistaceae bacterium]|jgi:hypothetical protein|nr:hypothetical protein [Synergistaceae bacterium]
MTVLLLYIALLLVLYVPGDIKRPGRWGMDDARTAGAFVMALFSACVLPWSGFSLMSPFAVGTWAWLPSIIAAIIIQPGGKSSGYAARSLLIASLIASAAAMSRFMHKTGVPGELYSIEGFSMILRLCGFSEAIAMCLMSAGLALSFMQAQENIGAFRMAAFSFSGFWAIVFVPLDFSAFWPLTPRMAAILTPAALFILSCLISCLFLKRHGLEEGHRGARKWLPVALTAAGCLLLAIR